MQDFRQVPEVIPTIAFCIEGGYSISDMMQRIRGKHPDASVTHPMLNAWISSPKFWQKLYDQDAENAQRLWNLRQSYLRSNHRAQENTQTLDEFLAPKQAGKGGRLGATHVRKAGFG